MGRVVGNDSASNIQHGPHAAEAGRGESGPARQHAHVLPSVVERMNVGNSLIVARLRRL